MKNLTSNETLVLTAIVSVLALTDVAMLAATYIIIKRKREEIRGSFDYFVEEEVSASGVGVIIYSAEEDIIWTSRFIEQRIGKNIIGKKIFSLSDDFKDKFVQGKKEFKFDLGSITFEAKINVHNRIVTLKDITNENMVLKQYIAEKLVVGELDIDNFQQYQVTLSEEDQFKIQSKVIKLLDKLSEQYNFIYRQYVNGKFIIFTNEKSLNLMIKTNFDFLDDIRKFKAISGVHLSASIGFGSGATNQKELTDLARDGLMRSQARGGDQVAVLRLNKKPEYFGSKSEIFRTVSKVQIKKIAEILETKISSREIKNVVIYGHKFADLDAVGASLGIAEIAKAYKKDYIIQNVTYDATTEKSMRELLTKEEYSFFAKPSRAIKETDEHSLVVIVDTAEVERIENDMPFKKVLPKNIFVFDHHRITQLPDEIPKENIYIDTGASSASEIIVELSSFLSIPFKPEKSSAQMLLNGIYLDSKNFTVSTSSRTYEAASILESLGASSNKASETLKVPEEASQYIRIITSRLEEVKHGYFMATYDEEVPSDIIAMAADEILRTQGRKAAFVIARNVGKNKEYKLSARGIDTNVQKIVEEVGGGGHFGAAAAISDEALSVFADNVRQAIVSKRGDD